MADISNVNAGVIKDLYERLESLGCMIIFPLPPMLEHILTPFAARIMTRILY